MSSVPFFLTFFAIVVGYAAWRGGSVERVTAGVLTVALLASASLGLNQIPGEFRIVPITLLLVDLALLVILCVIAIRANRWWPIPVAGLQLVAVLVHAGRMVDPDMIPNGYAFLTTIWSWPMVALLALGTEGHRRRRAQGIIVPDWKPFYARQG